jgi:galactarate dehydratase
MKDQWFDIIDVNAGPVATGEATIEEIGTELFHKIIRTAEGEETFSEKYGLANDLCIFNPAPIT